MSLQLGGFAFTAASIASTKLLFSNVPGTNMTAASAQLAAITVGSDDLDLVHASKNGDVAAFEQLVKRYDRKLFRIAQHVTHNREDAEDAVQEGAKAAAHNKRRVPGGELSGRRRHASDGGHRLGSRS